MTFKKYLISYFIGQLKRMSTESAPSFKDGAKSYGFYDKKKIKESSEMAEYIKRKNEAWLKNKDMHLKAVEEHFNEKKKEKKKYLDSVLLDQRTKGYGGYCSSYSNFFGYDVSDHVRRAHIRNTQHGPVEVRSHRVRAHKK